MNYLSIIILSLFVVASAIGNIPYDSLDGVQASFEELDSRSQSDYHRCRWDSDCISICEMIFLPTRARCVRRKCACFPLNILK
ncbi:unnamed protein product [Leptidea sinapis]|uniref:Invertebrate defensins family profile domain-containing protein n=1 Tax=Leptidea sinapis TaxID=189913 RepID=A0A5E4QLA6_9NEOP|nr:unnamed protein product [Leptidea sinapis]